MINDDIINQFVRKQKEPTTAFLKKQYRLSDADCEDIFQDSFLVLYEKNKNKELVNMNASLSTFFNGICRIKARELMRTNGNHTNFSDFFNDDADDRSDDERIDALLSLEDDSEQQFDEQEAALIRKIIKNLPPSCEKILRGFYWDGFSTKDLADMYNYRSEGAVKGKKHRCLNKFSVRFLELSKKIMKRN